MTGQMKTIILPKIATPTRPLNIASDPRVFRGSVIAKQREAIKQIQQELELREAEEQWRVNAVKNKINLAFGSASLMEAGQTSPSEVPLGYRIARLNGPVRRHILDSTANVVLPAIDSPLGIDARMLPFAGTIGDAAAKRLQETAASHHSDTAQNDQVPKDDSFQLKHSASAGSLLPELKPKDRGYLGPKNVYFVPPRFRASRHSKLAAKCASLGGKANISAIAQRTIAYDPRFGKLGGIGERGVNARQLSQLKTLKQKLMNSRSDQNVSTRLGSNPQLFPHQTKTWDSLIKLVHPSRNTVDPSLFSHQSCQTDESLAFEETFQPLISEMVCGAIKDAQRSLMESEELLRMENQNKELLRIVVSEKQKNTELIQNIQEHTEIQKTLEAEKKNTEFILDVLEYYKVASKEVEKLIDNCLNQLLNRAFIKDEILKKDAAADTRQLEQTNKQMQRIMKEVECDFFPYVYQKAERVFVHTLADSFLKDALFSNNDQFRQEAHSRLNEKITEYNQLLRKTKPRQQGDRLSHMLGRLDSPSPTKIIDGITDIF